MYIAKGHKLLGGKVTLHKQVFLTPGHLLPTTHRRKVCGSIFLWAGQVGMQASMKAQLLTPILPDFSRPPANQQQFEKAPNTVTLTWNQNPDVQEDGDAHYVTRRGMKTAPVWFAAAKHVFSNKCMVTRQEMLLQTSGSK